MIRDPSDGTVREIAGWPSGCLDPDSCAHHGRCMYIKCPNYNPDPVIDTSTSGLPITKAKADYLARLEESRKWLTDYVHPTIEG